MAPLRLKYQTIDFGNLDIHLCGLRDNQEFSDPDGDAQRLGISSAVWPLFGQVWPSGIVLANFMVDFDTAGKRILEVGCGLGLSSLLLNKQGKDITATDYHPSVNTFLQRNTCLNNDPEIPFQQADWADTGDSLGLFDLIIGSDLLYEDDHIELLATFIDNHSKKTSQVVLVDPGRGRKTKLAKRLKLSGFDHKLESATSKNQLKAEFKGHILTFTRRVDAPV